MDAILLKPEFVEACALLQYFGDYFADMPTHPGLAEIILAEPLHDDLLRMFHQLLDVKKTSLLKSIQYRCLTNKIDLNNQQRDELLHSTNMNNFSVPLKLALTLFLLQYRLFDFEKLPDSEPNQLAARRNASRLGCDRAATTHWFIVDAQLNVHVYVAEAQAAAALRLVASSVPELCALIARYGDEEKSPAHIRNPLGDFANNGNCVPVNERVLRKHKTANTAHSFRQCASCSATHTELKCDTCPRAWHTKCLLQQQTASLPMAAGWVCPLCAEMCLLARLHEVRACLAGMSAMSLRQRREAIACLPSCDDDHEFITTTAMDTIRAANEAATKKQRIKFTVTGSRVTVTGRQPLSTIHRTSIYFADMNVWLAHIQAVRCASVELVEQLERCAAGATDDDADTAPDAVELHRVYVQHVRPILELDVHIWEGGCTADDYAAFDAVQARAQRAILAAAKQTPKPMRLESLAERRQRITRDTYRRLLADRKTWEDVDMPKKVLDHLSKYQKLRFNNSLYVLRNWTGCFLQRGCELIQSAAGDVNMNNLKRKPN